MRRSSPRTVPALLFRPADPGDVEPIAALLFEAGGDALQFILDELAPGMNARALYRYMVALDADQYSYRRCHVAQFGCEIVGVINAFPAELLRSELGYELSPREAHVMGRHRSIDFRSYVINNIAVDKPYRRRGIAARLIESTAERARSSGFKHLHLTVWADNSHARALYAKLGFKDFAQTEMPWHPELPHEGGRITMRRCLMHDAGMVVVADALGGKTGSDGHRP